MIQSQVKKHFIYVIILFWSLILPRKCLTEFLIIKVNIRKRVILYCFVSAIALISCCKFSEIHDILGQSSCLVRKYIFNLAQLFIQIWTLHDSWLIFLLVVYWHIPLYEDSLGKFDYFDWHKQRYWNHICEEQNPGSKSAQPISDVHVPLPVLFWGELFLRGRQRIQISIRIKQIYAIPNEYKRGSYATQSTLSRKNDHDRFCNQSFQFGPLLLRSNWIAHNSRIVTSMDHHANNPVCISQTRPS